MYYCFNRHACPDIGGCLYCTSVAFATEEMLTWLPDPRRGHTCASVWLTCADSYGFDYHDGNLRITCYYCDPAASARGVVVYQSQYGKNDYERLCEAWRPFSV